MKNKRRNYFIEKSFQTKFILKFCIIVLATFFLIGIILLILSRNSTTVAIENTKVAVKTTVDFLFPIILQTLVLVSIFATLSTVIITLFISHKIAGPLYRIKREIKKIQEGNLNADFNIRSTDQLQDLATALKDMQKVLLENLSKIKDVSVDLKKILKENPQDKEKIELKLKDLDNLINFFKF